MYTSQFMTDFKTTPINNYTNYYKNYTNYVKKTATSQKLYQLC